MNALRLDELPTDIGVAEFDALHDTPERWREAITALAARVSTEPVQPVEQGTVLVALLGRTQALKLYPPFLHDHFTFERAVLARIGGELSLPTPRLLDSGSINGWSWVLMTQLQGRPMTEVWKALPEPDLQALLHRLGALAAEVHARPAADVAAVAGHAPAWSEFIAGQRERCYLRQQRTGLPEHLLAQLPAFLDGPLPEGPDVILTGEYTPMNLLVDERGRLAGMLDFGDGLIGPRAYDWLGPMCFFGAGHPQRLRAFFDGYGEVPDEALRLTLLRLMLLHRYSNLRVQLALPNWQQAPSFEALAAWLWS